MTAYEELDALYATLPTIKCKGLCQDYCGPIMISKIEARRLEEKRASGSKLPLRRRSEPTCQRRRLWKASSLDWFRLTLRTICTAFSYRCLVDVPPGKYALSFAAYGVCVTRHSCVVLTDVFQLDG